MGRFPRRCELHPLFVRWPADRHGRRGETGADLGRGQRSTSQFTDGSNGRSPPCPSHRTTSTLFAAEVEWTDRRVYTSPWDLSSGQQRDEVWRWRDAGDITRRSNGIAQSGPLDLERGGRSRNAPRFSVRSLPGFRDHRSLLPDGEDRGQRRMERAIRCKRCPGANGSPRCTGTPLESVRWIFPTALCWPRGVTTGECSCGTRCPGTCKACFPVVDPHVGRGFFRRWQPACSGMWRRQDPDVGSRGKADELCLCMRFAAACSLGFLSNDELAVGGLPGTILLGDCGMVDGAVWSSRSSLPGEKIESLAASPLAPLVALGTSGGTVRLSIVNSGETRYTFPPDKAGNWLTRQLAFFSGRRVWPEPAQALGPRRTTAARSSSPSGTSRADKSCWRDHSHVRKTRPMGSPLPFHRIARRWRAVETRCICAIWFQERSA